MTLAYLLIVVVPALIGVYTLASTVRGLWRLPELRRVPYEERDHWPRLHIVTPACNEERHVESAVRSMLSLDYPDVSVIAVDDRSTDATGALLDALAREDPRLTVEHIRELPEGWLGKVHALQVGASRGDGEWLLLMDADAHLGQRTVKRAISYAVRNQLDCLSVVPQMTTAGLLGDAVFDVSLALMSNDDRLRSVVDPRSRHVAATGAFILVRKATFDRTPGFEWLRLEVADDFGLMLLMKTHGGKCAIVNARAEVTLEWYASFGEMARAMQKNFFAIMARFSLLRAIALSLFASWIALSAVAALLPGSAPLRVLCATGYVAMTVAVALAASVTGRPWRAALLWPLGFLGIAWLSLRSGLVGARLRGIEWRGVVYPSALLAAAQRVRV